jgi:hypothetical protein
MQQPRAMFLLRFMPVSRLLLPCRLLQVHRSEGLIYVVLEFGDIDLARLLQVRRVCRLNACCCRYDGCELVQGVHAAAAGCAAGNVRSQC